MSRVFKFTKRDKAEMLYLYLSKNLYFREVADHLSGRFPGITASVISDTLRDTGVSGSENNRGRSARGHGTSSNKFRNEVYVRERDGKVLRADINLFIDYYNNRSPMQPLIDYLENGPIRATPKKAGAIVAGVVGAVILGDAIGVGNFVNIGRVDVFDRTPSSNTTFKEDFVDEAKDIAKDKAKDTVKDAAVGVVKSKLSGGSDTKATKKEPGIFDYNGYSYLGRVSGGKPYKVCFELNQFGSRALGNYSGGELDGYGIKFNEGANLNIGEFKKGELNGIGVTRMSGSIYVGKMKGGEPSGYAVRIDGDRNTIVKVGSKEIKEIGYVSGGSWYKLGKKVKEWKVKDNTYKGIKIDGNTITIDKTDVTINGGSINYSNKDVDLRYNDNGSSASYDDTKNNDKGTKLDYTGASILGEYYDVNLRVSTDITHE